MIDTGDDSLVKWLVIAGRQVSQHLGQQLAQINVSASQYYYLLKIHDNPGLTQKELIEVEFINPSRHRSATDKRAQALQLTAEGQKMYPKIKAILDREEALFRQVTKKQFPDFETDQLVQILKSFARLHGDTDKTSNERKPSK